MLADDLDIYLDALEQGQRFCVEAQLKTSPHETTEKVRFMGDGNGEGQLCIRKRIRADCGIGNAYVTLYEAQRNAHALCRTPRIYACYEHDDMLVVVMEYVEGPTLAQLRAERPLPLPDLIRLFGQTCDAVTELHEGLDPPLIHRDLKPSNIICASDGPTIIDFGIARSYREGAEGDTTHFGTRSYAPPEQFGYGQTDVRSDVYALGMLLWFMLTGQTPTSQDRTAGFAHEDVCDPLHKVIARAAAFDPDQRYASVRELKREFMRATVPGNHPNDQPSVASVAEQPVSASAAHVDAEEGAAEGPLRTDAEHAPDSSVSQEAAADEAHAAPPFFDGVLAHVPRPLGAIYNIAVAMLTALCIAGCISAFLEPSDPIALQPLWLRVLEYVVVFGVAFVLMGYALLDKRGLKRHFPVLARVRTRRLLAITVTYFVVGFTVVTTLAAIFGC